MTATHVCNTRNMSTCKHTRTRTHTHTVTPSKTGGLFGSDDEDDDMFFTPSKPKEASKPTATTSSAKKMTQAEKEALSAAAFGDSSSGYDFGADDGDLFGGSSAARVMSLVLW